MYQEHKRDDQLAGTDKFNNAQKGLLFNIISFTIWHRIVIGNAGTSVRQTDTVSEVTSMPNNNCAIFRVIVLSYIPYFLFHYIHIL